MTVTIYDMIAELNTWVKFSTADVQKAATSKITTKNNNAFRSLVKDWENGVYDEDPNTMASEILSLL